MNKIPKQQENKSGGIVRIGNAIPVIIIPIPDEINEPASATLSKPLTVEEKYNLIAKSIKFLENEAKSSPVMDPGIPCLSVMKHVEYKKQATREKTFTYWPISLQQTPQVLSNAGFFFSGTGDRVICYHCGGAIWKWSNGDDPWVAHAKLYPNCAYLFQRKGKAFIDSINGGIWKNLVSTESFSINSASSSSNNTKDVCEGGSSAQGELQVSPSKTVICTECNIRGVFLVNLPCGDMEYCLPCRTTIREKNCKKCNVPVELCIQSYSP